MRDGAKPASWIAEPQTRAPVLLLGLLIVVASPGAGGAANDEGPLCPGGEATLDSQSVAVTLRRPGRHKLITRRNTLRRPGDVATAIGAESVVYHVEADGVLVHRAEFPPGALASSRSGKTFRHKVSGSSLVLRLAKGTGRMKARFTGLDRTGLASGDAPARIKQILKIGDRCFSSILVCTARKARITCRPARTASLRGRVRGPGGLGLAGTMLTAYDDSRLESITVFAQENGRYAFPPLRPGSYRVRARLVGFEDAWHEAVVLAAGRTRRRSFTLVPTSDTNRQLPATHFLALLLDDWPSATSRGDFTLSCGNCHQIGDHRFRRERTAEDWNRVLDRMISYLPPFHAETREHLRDVVLGTFGPDAPPVPTFDVPAPPSGEILRTVIYEYGLGDETSRPGCHDLELGLDQVVYADGGVRWIDPRTGDRGVHPLDGGAHSIERDPDGNMWITQAGEDRLAFLDVRTGAFRYFPLPRIGDEQGSYPHTLRFDAQGRIWFSTTKSNHLTRFDPATEEFSYHPLPPADPDEVGLTIPTAYGCDVAPDGTVWYSQLHGQRVGRFTPGPDTIRDWRPPFYGPRRLHVAADGIVWVPGYGSGVLGRFDPAVERWKTYDLPTGIAGPPGYGVSEMPYALNVNRTNGEVWVTGSNSDTLIRFEPDRERFTVVPLPTRASYTREIEFDADDNVWTCTANISPGPGEPGRGKFVKIELARGSGVCGDEKVDAGEDCDDGNADDCDGCTSRCRVVMGCGDGAVCANEACDDGNADDCDGCSSSCAVEEGLRCGDAIRNAACGEVCDPPAPGTCTEQCQLEASCGNGMREDGEDCDDGNADDCDGCTSDCTLVTGCGDGVRCGVEECDDGNGEICDGCLPTCELEAGHVCGDGIVSGACGEECDPPSLVPECSYRCRLGPSEPLGVRHLSFGGQTYSSAVGTDVPLGTLDGAFDVVGNVPGPDGTTALSVTGPIHYRAAILGGAFGYMCFRISTCTGTIDCNSGTAVDVVVEQDSAGPGTQGRPTVVTTGLGPDGGAGAVSLACEQAFVQIPGGGGDDCTSQAYPPEQTVVYTTGEASGSWIDGDIRIGTGMIRVTGENFTCEKWAVEDGPGKLAGVFMLENDPRAGDTANATVIDD